jgi:hypothetical protein
LQHFRHFCTEALLVHHIFPLFVPIVSPKKILVTNPLIHESGWPCRGFTGRSIDGGLRMHHSLLFRLGDSKLCSTFFFCLKEGLNESWVSPPKIHGSKKN